MSTIWKVVGVLLVIWLGLAVLGAVFKALWWLLIVGAVLFVGTAAYGAIKGRNQKQLPR
ncbi:MULTISPECIES: hypothetical protein [Actinoalloteichus]|uniref:Uncharacterized protein n=1 Tax=Actinoalloteichus caeruleus DSM 43889 TaxID=1120930 RepID=A0ABT1JKQ9_ACTCY|nr:MULTISPECIES: hypothetical protein [Actinoalloteichus]MCP2333102.1 hypothetical protein [Actinoalloteichus caeruleus DSM 43889]